VVMNINEKLIGNLVVRSGRDVIEGRAKSRKWKAGFFLILTRNVNYSITSVGVRDDTEI